MTGTEGMRIRITEGGPYIVEGNVPIFEKRIRYSEQDGYSWEDVREIPHGPVYALCRCGKSTNAPFCDGNSHKRFKGKERFDRRPYAERCDRIEGSGFILEDDRTCSKSRFCHRRMGTPWETIDRSDDPEVFDEIVEATFACPSGRIQVIEDGEVLIRKPEPAIWIIQDPNKNVSGGIYVMGGIPLVGADGFEYEVRDRYVLCRCGVSDKIPFCDSSHINNMYRDDRNRKG